MRNTKSTTYHIPSALSNAEGFLHSAFDLCGGEA
nr:MAG TPA: hypothetical protein [Caudoviricetes sp.]